MEQLEKIVTDYLRKHPDVQNPMSEVDFFGQERMKAILKKAEGRRVEFFDDRDVPGWRDFTYAQPSSN